MITAFLISVGASIALWVATLFPTLTIPDGMLHVDDQINGIFAMGSGLGVWVDWGFVGIMAAFPLTIWTAGLTVKGIRVLVSHLPWVGGRG